MADTYVKNKRSKFAAFMNTAPGSTSPVWARFGKGITSQTVSYNPETTTEQYIDEDSSTTMIDRYAPTMDGTMTTYKGEPIFEFVDSLRRERAIGADAETDILLVYMYTAEDGSSSFEAEKQHVSVQIDEFGGEAGGSLPLNFTVNFMGDPVKGTASISNGTVSFTEDA